MYDALLCVTIIKTKKKLFIDFFVYIYYRLGGVFSLEKRWPNNYNC